MLEVLETLELVLVNECVEHEALHCEAIPTIMTSCQPAVAPFDQNVKIEAEEPIILGMKVIGIAIISPAAIVAPSAGKPVAVKAPPMTVELPEVVKFW